MERNGIKQDRTDSGHNIEFFYYNMISKNKLNWYKREKRKGASNRAIEIEKVRGEKKYASSTSSEHLCAYLQPLICSFYTFSLRTYFNIAGCIHIIQWRILSHLFWSKISFIFFIYVLSFKFIMLCCSFVRSFHFFFVSLICIACVRIEW